MRVTAQFINSVASIDQLPSDGLPEIALAGRSNVGKSSLLNTLFGNPKLARTSNTPGRTQTLNYYKATPSDRSCRPFYFVDMPGYGYAAVNVSKKAAWGKLIENYLNTHATLYAVIQLIDLRHPPQPLDYVMSEWIKEKGCRFLLVGTKADKIAKTKVAGALAEAAERLGFSSSDAIAFSAQTGMGKDALWSWIKNTIKQSE